MTPRRVALIGATSPIGHAIATRLAAGGARVVGVSLEQGGSEALYASVVADCSESDNAESAIDEAADLLGGLDVLIPAAGVMPVAPADRTTDQQWRGALSGCLDTFFFTARAALPMLDPGSAVVAVSSVNAVLAAPWVPAYAAAKGGVDALVRQLALDYGGRGIRVNAVAPGLVGGDDLPEAAAGYPSGRTVTATEVAAAVAFLAGPDADGINGVVLPVDGGLGIASPASFARPDLRRRLDRLSGPDDQ